MTSPNRRPSVRPAAGLEELELALLLAGIERRYGFDFQKRR